MQSYTPSYNYIAITETVKYDFRLLSNFAIIFAWLGTGHIYLFLWKRSEISWVTEKRNLNIF